MAGRLALQAREAEAQRAHEPEQVACHVVEVARGTPLVRDALAREIQHLRLERLRVRDGLRELVLRVRGADLMSRTLEAAAAAGVPVGLYGGRPEVLDALRVRIADRYPRLALVYGHAPPFREPTNAERSSTIEQLDRAGARIVFVGLGCPKQEHWMAAHRGQVRAVMLGVGAAFDMHAGVLAEAPPWMRDAGLEWLHRLAQDPRRLGRRRAA